MKKEIKTIRKAFEEAVIHMMINKEDIGLTFYSFIIAKCKVIEDKNIETAGVNFDKTHYNLYVGRKFLEWTLTERVAVLIHESRHILGGHVFRKGERNHGLFNIAADIAINQVIKNLPGGLYFPETFNFPRDLSAEQYYELLKEEKEKQEKEKKEWEENQNNQNGQENDEGQGNGENQENDEGQGNGKKDGKDPSKKGWPGPKNGNPDITEADYEFDDHSKWSESGEEEEIAKSITEKMIDDAVSVSRGNLPGDIENILKIWKRKPKISWKKELRKILASKSGKRVLTIKKKDRRFPNRDDLRGKRTHTSKREIIVCVDTSGSMSDEQILEGLIEINAVAKVNAAPMKIIQIDTEIKRVDEFDPKKPVFKRRGYGGTYMAAGVQYIMNKKMKADVVIFISDMYIEDVSKDQIWRNFDKTYNKKVLWLSSSGEIPEWGKNLKNHKIIDIKNV